MSGHRAVIGLGRRSLIMTISGICPAAAPPLAPARSATRTQAAGQLTAQLTASLDEEGLVDRLVAHLHHRIVGEG
jgi:hypothetical protein